LFHISLPVTIEKNKKESAQDGHLTVTSDWKDAQMTITIIII